MKVFFGIINNLGILITISIFSGIIYSYINKKHIRNLFAGLLFGAGSVIGMLNPLVISPGLIFDGRSVLISLSSLFFGPIAGTISVIMACLFRIHLGGIGTITGIIEIIASGIVGIIFYFTKKENDKEISLGKLLTMGLVVQIFILILIIILPKNPALSFLEKISIEKVTIPIIISYPLATIIIGIVLNKEITKRKILKSLIAKENQIISISNNLEQTMIYQILATKDGKRKFTYLSDSVSKLHEISPEQAKADANLIYSRVHEDDIERLISEEEKARKNLHTFKTEIRIREANGNIRWSSLISTPKLLEDGSILWDGIEIVITDRKNSEQMLQLQHDLILELNSCNDLHEGLDKILKKVLSIESIDCGGIYLCDQNDNSLSLAVHHGLSEDFISHVSYYPEDSPNVALVKNGEARYSTYDELISYKDEVRKKERLKGFAFIPVMHQEKLIALLNLASHSHDSIPDISRSLLETIALQIGGILLRIRTDAALQESEEIFKQFMEHSPIYVFFKDDQLRILKLSSNFQKLFGKPADELIGKKINEILPFDFASKILTIDIQILKDDKELITEEEINGRFYTTIKFPIHLKNKKTYLAGYRIDITEKKKIEQELINTKILLNEAFEQSPVPMALSTLPDYQFKIINKACEDFLLVKKEDYLNKKPDEIKIIWQEYSPDGRKITVPELPMPRALQGITTKNMEMMLERIDNSKVWQLASGAPIYDNEGKQIAAILIMQDITERKTAEENIKSALAEKEILLQELNHRTKNNMQVIIALLELKAAFNNDENLKSIIQNIIVRIKAMALVQEKLTSSKNLSRINLKEYITELVDLISNNYIFDKNKYKFELNIDEAETIIDVATPCGLILNELITNSLKHAFIGKQEGKITINLQRNINEIIIEYYDDGVGLPDNIDLKKSDTLGILTIFNIIEHQLKGKINYEVNGGLKYSIVFKDNLYQERI